MIALDASALLAFLFRETGHERVTPHLGSACISAVNLAEVLVRFARDGHDPAAVLEPIQALRLEVVPYGEVDAVLSAGLLSRTSMRGLSLGDRACLALAAARGIPALTADRTWLELDVGVAVESVR